MRCQTPPAPRTVPWRATGVRPLAVLLTLAALAGHGPLRAEANAGVAIAETAQSTARVGLRVQVPRVFTLRVLAQPRQLEISDADIARGWVEAAESMDVLVFSNATEGWGFTVSESASFARRIRMVGPQGAIDWQHATAATRQSRTGPQGERVQLRFRFELNETARPGRYPWPIHVSGAQV